MRSTTYKGPSSGVVFLPLLLSLILFHVHAGADKRPSTAPPGPALAELENSFQSPPDDARIMMRWWWFGPAVTDPEIERELRIMKQGGIGGVEIQPVYPLGLDDPVAGIRNLPFLSDDFINALRFASEKAREFGLRIDLTLGSGWPYGGAQVAVRHAAGMLRVERAKLDESSGRVPVPAVAPG